MNTTTTKSSFINGLFALLVSLIYGCSGPPVEYENSEIQERQKQQEEGIALASNTPLDIYPFDFGDIDRWSIAKTSRKLRKAGYIGLAAHPSRINDYLMSKPVKRGQLEIPAVYLKHDVSEDGFSIENHKEIIDAIADRGPILWVWFRDPKKQLTEKKVERLIVDLLEYADGRVRIALYPHSGTYFETAVAAFKMAEKIGNKENLGITVNLIHELRANRGGKKQLKTTFKKVKNRIFAITISGAQLNERGDADVGLIDAQDYDIKPFLLNVKASGYKGPIGILNHKLEDPEFYLPYTMEKWIEYSKDLNLYKNDI